MSGLKSKWVIIRQIVDGKAEYQVSNNVIGLRTISYDFDTLEDAKERLEEVREIERDQRFNNDQANKYFGGKNE